MIIINTIIHPFFTGHRITANHQLYQNIVNETLVNPDRYIYYDATETDLLTKPITNDRGWDYQEEKELQFSLRNTEISNPGRIAIIADSFGEYNSQVDVYRKPSLSIRNNPFDKREKTPIHWFLENGIQTYYDAGLRKSYTDISEMEDKVKQFFWNYEKQYINGHTYLITELHPQIAKMLKSFGLENVDIDIDGSGSSLSLPESIRRQIYIVGSGEFLDACVLTESTGLAITLGVPLENISLNMEQPHIQDGSKREASFYQHPIEYICKNISPRIEGNMNSEGRV